MIRALVSVIVRSLVELALVLVVIGVLLLGVAGIMGQRIITTNPNLVERAAEKVAGILAALARGARAGRDEYDDDEGLGVHPSDFEYDDDDDRRPVRREPIQPHEWKDLVV